MAALRCIGGCLPLFLLALVLDALGLVLIFIGIFANLRVDGRFYGDFLIYTGALLVFASLACWLMWYVANVQVRDGEEPPGAAASGGLARLARKLSERLSRRLQKDEGVKCVREEEEEEEEEEERGARRAGRVTWGRSAVYSNHGYEDEPGGAGDA